jgi:hypothetical protein
MKESVVGWHAHWTTLVLVVANVLSFIDRATFTQLLIRIKVDLVLSDIQVFTTTKLFHASHI